jgi:phenylacetate-CoA ligase
MGFRERSIQRDHWGKSQIANWLMNTTTLNSFRMTSNDIEKYIHIINTNKPDLIRGLQVLCKRSVAMLKEKKLIYTLPKFLSALQKP